MTFKDWWDNDGARFYASSHEERARQAWEAATVSSATSASALAILASNLDCLRLIRGLSVVDRLGRMKLELEDGDRCLRVIMVPLMKTLK